MSIPPTPISTYIQKQIQYIQDERMRGPLYFVSKNTLHDWQCWPFWCKISSQIEAKCQIVRNVGIWYRVTSACETMKHESYYTGTGCLPAIYVLHSFSCKTVQNIWMVSEAGYNCWFPITYCEAQARVRHTVTTRPDISHSAVKNLATAVVSTHARRESSTSVCFVSTIFSK